MGLGELGEEGGPAEVFEVGSEDDEIHAEHGGVDFAAVGAVAEVVCGFYQAGLSRGLWWCCSLVWKIGTGRVVLCDTEMEGHTKASCTAPQKQVAVASPSLL